MTRFALNKRPPEECLCIQGRRSNRSQQAQGTCGRRNRKTKIGRCEGITRHLSIPDDEADYEEIVNNARRKLETRTASAMLCKVIPPTNPNGSCWWRSCASDWCNTETKRWNSSCSKKDHDDIITESHRIRTSKSTEETTKEHIADRGHVSMSHYNMVHKPIPVTKAVNILQAKAVLDTEWATLQKLRARAQSDQ